jgi:hypothetical protein
MKAHQPILMALQSLIPARLNQEETARFLGFAVHDIPVLTAAGLLKPLGRPTPTAVKYFATVELEALRADAHWLSKATEAVMARWRFKNHHQTPRTVQGRRLEARRQANNNLPLTAHERPPSPDV